MKTLILFRHAKAGWDLESGDDHERPVADRGQKAARTMGRFLSQAQQVPDAVITSSAVRARTTVELAAAAGDWKCPVRVTRALYEATPFAVLEEVRAEPPERTSLLLAGHEPTWSELVSLLIGGGTLGMPTACMARIDFGVECWKAIDYGIGNLAWLLPAKVFTEGKFGF
jgi:phosphohistidine phosphatase